MAQQYNFTFTPEQVRQTNQVHAEFHHAYGLAMAQWAKLERMLYYWFAYITRVEDKMARAIFFSGRSFNARAEMLLAAIEHAQLSAGQIEFIKASHKRAWGYSGFRNTITHGESMMNAKLLNGVVQSVEYLIVQGKAVGPQGTDVSIDQLLTAADNFHRLAEIIHNAHPVYGEKPQKPPEEYLALVNALPNQANSKNVQTPSTPGPQPQDDRVNKKAYRAEQAATKTKPSADD